MKTYKIFTFDSGTDIDTLTGSFNLASNLQVVNEIQDYLGTLKSRQGLTTYCQQTVAGGQFQDSKRYTRILVVSTLRVTAEEILLRSPKGKKPYLY